MSFFCNDRFINGPRVGERIERPLLIIYFQGSRVVNAFLSMIDRLLCHVISDIVKLPAHRPGLPGDVNTVTGSVFFPTCKAGHQADLPAMAISWRLTKNKASFFVNG
jgi:hypothetical protein